MFAEEKLDPSGAWRNGEGPIVGSKPSSRPIRSIPASVIRETRFAQKRPHRGSAALPGAK